MEAMAKLQQQDAFVAVLNTAAAIRFLPSPEVFKNHCITLKQDQEIEYEDLSSFSLKQAIRMSAVLISHCAMRHAVESLMCIP